MEGRRCGKVRDTYLLPTASGAPPRILIVATDRISAFDVVLPTPIPGKGRLLTEIASFWFGFIESRGLCRTHLVSTDAGAIPDSAFGGSGPGGSGPGVERFRGRVTVGRACRVLPVEFVVRGYLEGSGWRDYERTGAVCGVGLPPGLRRCERLPEPVFTPATKAEQGEHDENIGEAEAFSRIDAIAGSGVGERLAGVSLSIYRAAAEHAASRGVILADTKFEFGLPVGADGEPDGGEPLLIDEALTPPTPICES